MAEALKTFREGEDILASETNGNNQFLLSKLSDNAAQVQQYVEGEVATIKSNVASVQATLQEGIETITNDFKSFAESIYTNIIPDYTKGVAVPYPLSGSKFTAPSNGVYITTIWANNASVRLYINGLASAFFAVDNATGTSSNSFTIPLAKGDVIYWSQGANVRGSSFYPFRGQEEQGE